jgi:hypothetical protein
MPPVTVIDPLQILVQGGGLGIAAFLIIWITRTQTTLIQSLIAAVEENTKVLREMERLIVSSQITYARDHSKP